MANLKIIVTGGCGFIGSHIVDELQAKGHCVLAVDDLSSGKKERVNSDTEIADIKNTKNLIEIFLKFRPDVVIHAAAQVMLRKSLEDPVFDAQNNIIGTISVLEACKLAKIKKFIYTSTGGAIYGELEKPYLVLVAGKPIYAGPEKPLKEDSQKEPLSPYGISKYTAEHYIRFYAKHHGFDYLIFRFGNVYGPRDDPITKRIVTLIIESLLNNKDFNVFGDGNQRRDFLYVKDIAKLITKYIDKNTKSTVYNLGLGTGISVNDVYKTIAKHLGVQNKLKYSEEVQGEARHNFLDTTRAKEELNWNPTPFEQGIKETIEWFKKN